jgi:murein DD-endopeptidase MepM/ murein hydrolase activator NlpD
MKREVAVLARENARVQAALSGYEGANPGTGEIVPGLDGPVLYRFGWPAGLRHAGIDIGVPAGTPVHAADSGRVVLSGVIGGYRKYVCVQYTQTLSTRYAHNSRLRVTEGERCTTATSSSARAARAGATGRTSTSRCGPTAGP